jgi:hypothetical protein
MNTVRAVAVAHLCAVFFLSGCGTMGDILGGGSDSNTPADPSTSQSTDVRGTVESVNAQQRTLTIAPEQGSGSNLRNNDRIVLTYDTSTVVEYQGQTYRPEDLENGDRIEAATERSGDRLLVRRITVLSDVSGDGAALPNQIGDFDGTVLGVNSSRRTIQVDPFGNDTPPVEVAYDSGTRVEYQGRSYRPEDLERGDSVRVRTRSSASAVVADDIMVMRDANTNGMPTGQQLRGTVRSIDTNSRTIELEGVSWAQSFDTKATENSTRVGYDANTVVEYRGKRYNISNLEPGDLVDVEVVGSSADRQMAKRIVVARSA